MRRLLALAALVLALLTAAAPALAATPRVEFTDVEDEVMCTTCNVPLNIADSPQATAERAEIRRLIAQGLTKDQVLDRLVVQYGTNVLAQPKSDGIGLFAYLVPIGAGVLLIGLLVVLLPRWRRRPASGPGLGGGSASSGAALSALDERRLDEDLARYDL